VWDNPPMGRRISSVARLRAALDALGDQIAAVDFGLPSADQQVRRELRDELGWMIREYLIPRLADLDTDVVAVVVGSTGSGKSTLVNTLAQRPVSQTGPIRPTTKAPVIWCHEKHAQRYRDTFMSGYGIDTDSGRSLRVVADTAPLLRGVTLIDAPDFDSVIGEHREIVTELLAIADICIFVTSAQRYADAVPWEFLDRARRRKLPIVFVVNRLPDTGVSEILADYSGHLRRRDILQGDPSIVEIREQTIIPEYMGLTPGAVDGLRERLAAFADPGRRYAVIVDTTKGAVEDVVARSGDLAAAIRQEAEEGAALIGFAKEAYFEQLDEIGRALDEDSLIRAEGGTRRKEFGASVARRLDLAASQTAAAWELDPAGRVLLGDAALWKRAPEATGRIEEAIGAARRGLLERLRDVFDADEARFAGRVEALLSGSTLGLRHATATVREAAEIFYGG